MGAMSEDENLPGLSQRQRPTIGRLGGRPAADAVAAFWRLGAAAWRMKFPCSVGARYVNGCSVEVCGMAVDARASRMPQGALVAAAPTLYK